MSDPVQVRFHSGDGGRLLLPSQCSISTACYDAEEVRQAVALVMEQMLYVLAWYGLDLRALDGITLSSNCRRDAIALQKIPEGQTPSEIGEQPDTMELARTVAVRREEELRFHMVVEAGVGLMTLSPDENLQRLAQACIAHEAAHVEHEGQLYRSLPGIYGGPLECGDRLRRTFLKGMDVWSEYAACRTSALFRPEALEEFEALFCRALEDGLTACEDRIAVSRSDRNNPDALREVDQIFGDMFICAGYFLGHLAGMELNLEKDALRAFALLQRHPEIEVLMMRLCEALNDLWLSEQTWKSIEVFAPIYDLICETMALQGLVFTRHHGEWRIVMREDEQATPAN